MAHLQYESIFDRLMKMGLALIGLMILGTIGYMIVERWSPLDALFMTVITLSTVGYGETNSLTGAGRSFTIVLIVVSMIGMSLWTASVTSFFVENDLRKTFQKRRMRKMINRLSQHAIICGATDIGLSVAVKLIESGQSVVIIDTDEQLLNSVVDRLGTVLTVHGNPTDELTLADAGLISAKYVVAATNSDIDNLLIAFTSKEIGGSVVVIAKCEDFSVGNRMRKAGVDAIVNPNEVAGKQIFAHCCN